MSSNIEDRDQAIGFCLIYSRMLSEVNDKEDGTEMLDELKPTLKNQLQILEDYSLEVSATDFGWLDTLVSKVAAHEKKTESEYIQFVLEQISTVVSEGSSSSSLSENGEPEIGWVLFNAARFVGNQSVQRVPSAMRPAGKRALAWFTFTHQGMKYQHEKAKKTTQQQ